MELDIYLLLVRRTLQTLRKTTTRAIYCYLCPISDLCVSESRNSGTIQVYRKTTAPRGLVRVYWMEKTNPELFWTSAAKEQPFYIYICTNPKSPQESYFFNHDQFFPKSSQEPNFFQPRSVLPYVLVLSGECCSWRVEDVAASFSVLVLQVRQSTICYDTLGDLARREPNSASFGFSQYISCASRITFYIQHNVHWTSYVQRYQLRTTTSIAFYCVCSCQYDYFKKVPLSFRVKSMYASCRSVPAKRLVPESPTSVSSQVTNTLVD